MIFLLNSSNANHPIAESDSQFDMQTLEKIISDMVRSEVENVVVAVDTRVNEVILSAMGILFVPRMELAMRSIGISLATNLSTVVLDPDHRYFSGDKNGLQITASGKSYQVQT